MTDSAQQSPTQVRLPSAPVEAEEDEAGGVNAEASVHSASVRCRLALCSGWNGGAEGPGELPSHHGGLVNIKHRITSCPESSSR